MHRFLALLLAVLGLVLLGAIPADAATKNAGIPGLTPYGGYLGNYLAPDAVTFIEWAQPALGAIEEPTIIHLGHETPTTRRAGIRGPVAGKTRVWPTTTPRSRATKESARSCGPPSRTL